MSAVSLRAFETGQGPPVLFGGSLGTTQAMWEPQISTLSQRARVIAFDLRGHGASPVPAGPYSIADLGADVLALMDRLKIDRATYCGLSLGGMIGQWLGINAPARIQRLILICTSPHLPPASAWLQRAATVREAGSPEAVADAVVARWFTRGFTGQHPDDVARYRAMIAAAPAEGYAACCEAVAGHDVRDSLSGVRAPTLVIAGAQDPAAPPEHGRAMAAAIPDARFELLDPAAHLASVERADQVNVLIAQHLEREGA